MRKIWNIVQVLYSRYAMVNIFCHQHAVASSKLKQNTAVTRAKIWISGLHFPVCITHPTRSWMRVELHLDHVEAAQGSSLHGMDDRCMCSNATLLMSLRHIVENSVDSFYMLLGVYYSLLPATSVVLWLCYTLNTCKLDTASNGIYVVRNPRTGYITTTLHSCSSSLSCL